MEDALLDLIDEIYEVEKELREEEGAGSYAAYNLGWVRTRLLRIIEADLINPHPFVAWPRYPYCRLDGCGLKPEDPIHDVDLEI